MRLYATIASATVLTIFLGYHAVTNGNEPVVQTTRMMSLGTPHVLQLDTKEQVKVILNDPNMKKNWGLLDTNVTKAWDITVGDGEKVVAVIDTGIDLNHPDLAANIWVNNGEVGLDADGNDKAHNGIDDDENGYVDDVNGWDFVNNSPVIKDNHGHGTHIAGIIGANGRGGGKGPAVGNCPKVKLMALKYFDPQSRGGDNLKNTVRAIQYAVKMGANIINYSGGGLEPNDDEYKAIKEARDKGILFVAAAGNERSNSDFAHYYPANYNLDNIISVTAVDKHGMVLKTSNYGIKSVNVASPGEDIYSTLPNGQRGTMTGTSQATAFVSGVAALVLSNNKEYNYLAVKKQIIDTADELPSLRGKTAKSSKLNSYAALAIQPEIPVTGISANVRSATTGNVANGVILNRSATSESQADLMVLMRYLKQPTRQSASSKN